MSIEELKRENGILKDALCMEQDRLSHARHHIQNAQYRIKRLEEALAEIAYAASHPLGAGQSLTLGKIESIAIKAKEAKA